MPAWFQVSPAVVVSFTEAGIAGFSVENKLKNLLFSLFGPSLTSVWMDAEACMGAPWPVFDRTRHTGVDVTLVPGTASAGAAIILILDV